MAVDVAKLQAFAPEDGHDATQCEIAIESAVALIEGYTRGNHLNLAGKSRPGVDAVTLTVAARIVANPGQISRQDSAGTFSRRRGEGFSGFTLAELAILNRYRRRAIGP